MTTQANTSLISRGLLFSAALSVVPMHGTSIDDSYRQSLMFRQLNRDCIQECANQNLLKSDAQDDDEVASELSAHEILVEFKNDGFPIATIASMAGVERKTIYAWLDGAILKQENEARLYQLHSLLNQNKLASYRNLYRYMNRQVEGMTLASALSSDTLDHELIVKLLDRLWLLAEKTERSLASNDTPSNAGNPVIDESLEV